MAGLLENHIVAAEPNPRNHTVRLLWKDGTRKSAEFGALVGEGVFEAFRDRDYFNGVTVQEQGLVLAWPSRYPYEHEIDFSADSLWFDAHPEDIPEEIEPFYRSVKVTSYPAAERHG